jgi:hypothetical protein
LLLSGGHYLKNELRSLSVERPKLVCSVDETFLKSYSSDLV